MLRELLRRRFISDGIKGDPKFEQIWQDVCVSHIDGEESSGYLIDRCLMRPRNLIELLHYCRSHAVNLGHSKIQVDDIKQGEQSYSSDLVANIGYEIRDVYPMAGDILYEFAGHSSYVNAVELSAILIKSGIVAEKHPGMVELLLWYGFLGFVRGEKETAYIHTIKYDMKLLKSLIGKAHSPVYYINPAFWTGLEVQP